MTLPTDNLGLRHRKALAVSAMALLFCVVFLIDIATPRGVATGIIYMPLVFCGLRFNRPHAAFILALTASVLTLLAFFMKASSDAPMWMALTNRMLAVGTLGLVALLVYFYRRSEEARKQSESRLRAVVEHTADGVISLNERGIVEHFNPACERMFGYGAEEIIGKPLGTLMPEPYSGERDGGFPHYLLHGERSVHPATALRRDGSTFPVDVSINGFQQEDGWHFSGVIRDITERRRAEEERMRYTRDLERSNQELDEFAHIASHDLKEPLRGLCNNARFLQEDYQDRLDAEGLARLTRMTYLCRRMERLISDLLYFSRLGSQELAIQATDLNAVVREIESMMETTLREQNAAILIPRPLPIVTCDKPRVTEALRNLITNAVKYNAREKKTVEIGCREETLAASGGGQQVFYVRDDGIGIGKAFHEEIFRMFKRLNEEADGRKGTGVGLAFVRKIIERHGGRVWVESAPGEGATFYFTLHPEPSAVLPPEGARHG